MEMFQPCSIAGGYVPVASQRFHMFSHVQCNLEIPCAGGPQWRFWMHDFSVLASKIQTKIDSSASKGKPTGYLVLEVGAKKSRSVSMFPCFVPTSFWVNSWFNHLQSWNMTEASPFGTEKNPEVPWMPHRWPSRDVLAAYYSWGTDFCGPSSQEKNPGAKNDMSFNHLQLCINIWVLYIHI